MARDWGATFVSGWTLTSRAIIAWIGVIGVLLLIGYAAKVSAVYSRRALFIWFALTPALVAGALVVLRQWFRSALINLIDNAVDATEAPGEILLSAQRANGILRVAVSDTGPGIPAEDKEKLFLPYYSTKGRGTGLGLAIVHRIVADHHGTIRVEDNEPHGSVFTIEIPQ